MSAILSHSAAGIVISHASLGAALSPMYAVASSQPFVWSVLVVEDALVHMRALTVPYSDLREGECARGGARSSELRSR